MPYCQKYTPTDSFLEILPILPTGRDRSGRPHVSFLGCRFKAFEMERFAAAHMIQSLNETILMVTYNDSNSLFLFCFDWSISVRII